MESSIQPNVQGKCPSCKEPIFSELDQCHSCSYPFYASDEAKSAFKKERRKLVTEWYGYDLKVERTGTLLIFLGIFGLVQMGILLYFSPYLLRYNLIPWVSIVLIVSISLSLMYIATGILGRKFGLVPIMIGGGIYLLEFLGRFALRPFDLWHIPRVMLLFFLIAGFLQAIKAQEAKKKIEAKLGPGFSDYLDKNKP